jgi:hypothetical protein
VIDLCLFRWDKQPLGIASPLCYHCVPHGLSIDLAFGQLKNHTTSTTILEMVL